MVAAGDGAFQRLYDEVFIAEGWRATEGAAETTYLPHELGGRHVATVWRTTDVAVCTSLRHDIYNVHRRLIKCAGAADALAALAAWRDGGGPTLGVISNWDERLPKVLR